MSTAQSAAPDIRAIDLSSLVPSQTEAQKQRRAHFDKVSLQQLAENIKVNGLVHPILARPAGKSYEIVAGERRYQAAKLAGLDSILCQVRNLDDDQVLELQLVENLQREGLHELHEAEGYEALRKRGLSAIEIAAKVNKSKEYVFGRMKLLALCKDVRDAFYEGEINAAVALLIARIPVDKLQKEALKDVTKGQHGQGPMSYRDAKEHLQRKFMLRLDQAPFDTADATLLKSAKACGGCPKNTQQQPELFGDVKAGSAGVCTDPVCFQSKVSAAIANKVKAAKAEGITVLEGKNAKAVFPYGGTHYAQNGFKLLDGEVWTGGSNRKVRSLLRKGEKPALVLIEQDGREQLIEVVRDNQLDLPKAKASSSSSSSRSSSKASSSSPKENAKEKAEQGLRLAVLADLHAETAKPLHRDELEAIADQLQDTCYAYSVIDQILGKNAALNLKKLTEQQLLKLIRVLLFADVCDHVANKPDLLFAAAKRAGVNVESIRKELAAEAATKGKTAAPAAKGKEKAKGKKGKK